jgi:membrane fusion protein (multidrug efflux system)
MMLQHNLAGRLSVPVRAEHAPRTSRTARCRAAALAVLAAAAFVPGCAEEKEEVVITAPPVMVVPIELRNVRDRIEATGQLVARSTAQIAAQVGGEITVLHVDEGATVEQGDVLLEIDPERRHLELANQQAMVAQARAKLADTQRERKRIASLRERGAVSAAQVDEAQTQTELARSALEGALAQLGLAQRAVADSKVVAPFSGRVARRFCSKGEFVSTGKALFELVDPEEMEVEFHLAEKDSSLVEVGDAVEVRVAPYPGDVFSAVVTLVSPTIDPKTRTLRVKAEVDNRDGRLRPGLFARADLGIENRTDVVMIPEDAIVLRADGSIVFRLVGEREVQRVQVETGVYRDGWVEIEDGLAAEDIVVVRGHARLVDGAVVEVRTLDGGEPASFVDTGEASQTAQVAP